MFCLMNGHDVPSITITKISRKLLCWGKMHCPLYTGNIHIYLGYNLIVCITPELTMSWWVLGRGVSVLFGVCNITPLDPYLPDTKIIFKN